MPDDRVDLLASVLPLAKALRRIEDAAAGAHGLTMWQYAVLLVVAAQPSGSQAELAARLDYSRNRLVADLDVLEARGLLVRRPGADRRTNELAATDDGVATMRAIQAAIHAGEDDLLSVLADDDRAELDRLLRLAGQAARQARETREVV
ncbi:MarR family transcriptional regulator [Iamia sp. SCSIO 61187]|uniref:MarR family winged helix-turn-helix transcriptional regulator n=1 Tax=Iamia sp. SCSIO 61187 TaxID=2722752 RepID=UPI001C626992|nr:MarR family transcriptional regulator [Iamia sp. SCSIO 61187]QYG91222.1 MarR family transcriptional regulator [Iamia sp. SCSIO 61187]